MPSIMDRVRAGVKSVTSPQQREALKSARSLFRRAQRAFAQPVNAERLTRELRRGGIEPGDVLMVHSSLSSMTNVEGGPLAVIRALQHAVTVRGGVMMPAYCSAEDAFERSQRGDPVDLRTLGSVNGKITSVFAGMPDVVRSSHPFSSICVWGERAAWIAGAHDADPKTSHADSPMGRLLALDGKIVGIGTTMGPVSFYHVLDDTWPEFPFDPYLRPEPVTYVDAQGTTVTRPVARYDRDRTKVRIDNDLGLTVRGFMTDHLRARGIRHDFTLGGAAAFWLPARAFYDELVALAQRGITIYSTDEEVHHVERRSHNLLDAGIRSRTEPGRRAGLRP
jgi:aminoglycoside 3-N-acetyltransferase